MNNFSVDLVGIFPIAAVAFFAIVLLLSGMYAQGMWRHLISFAGCLLGIYGSLFQYHLGGTSFGGLLYNDAFTALFNSLILGATLLVFMLNKDHLEAQRVKDSIDIDVLILLAVCGAMLMVASANLVVLFIGFELLSICVYVLTGLARKEQASAEAALKYFILGAFSSAFLLYGMALVYGATGSMELAGIAAKADARSPLLLLGIGLMVFGFGFKVSLVPFHFWTPDVYQGAPVSLAAFMAVVVKAAAFGSFLRVFAQGLGGVSEAWEGLFWVLAVLTMTIGNLLALRQRSIKRLLAYSSVAHAGYALIGMLALGGSQGAEAVIFYLAVYSLMTIASFGIVMIATAGTDNQYEADSFESFQGFGWKHPFLGLCMVIAMLSLAGMPPLAGFIGKFYLFASAIKAGYVSLAIIAAINSVVSLYYYLRVLVVMYFSEPTTDDIPPSFALSSLPQVAVYFATFSLIYLGLFSAKWFDFVAEAAKSLG